MVWYSFFSHNLLTERYQLIAFAFFALGNLQKIAKQSAEKLSAEGYDCAIINPRFTKPIDAAATEFFSRAADLVVTLEDHVLMGGYGSIVLELPNSALGQGAVGVWARTLDGRTGTYDDRRTGNHGGG